MEKIFYGAFILAANPSYTRFAAKKSNINVTMNFTIEERLKFKLSDVMKLATKYMSAGRLPFRG
jgi:hypothetical protein